jgi:tripartite-type tricarboxylate transporter receptor subunit TctC
LRIGLGYIDPESKDASMSGDTNTSRAFCALIAAALLVGIPDVVAAQGDYPVRAIKIIVPLPAGGAPDVVSRIVAEGLTVKLGQPVVIENRPGAAHNIGANAVAKAEPDGYTLLSTPPGPLVTNQLLYTELPFDPSAFVPVTILTTQHLVLLASPKVPVSTLQELVAFAKANPGKLTYASPGTGTSPHLTGEILQAAAGIRTTHVPYKGLTPALADLMAGHVDIMFDDLGNSLSYVSGGQVKALGVVSKARIPELPNVPTIAETYPDFMATSWFAVVAPPKTPPEIADKLSRAIADTLRLPEVAKRLHDLSLTPVGSSPGETAAFIKRDAESWRKVILSAGIRIE